MLFDAVEFLSRGKNAQQRRGVPRWATVTPLRDVSRLAGGHRSRHRLICVGGQRTGRRRMGSRMAGPRLCVGRTLVSQSQQSTDRGKSVYLLQMCRRQRSMLGQRSLWDRIRPGRCGVFVPRCHAFVSRNTVISCGNSAGEEGSGSEHRTMLALQQRRSLVTRMEECG